MRGRKPDATVIKLLNQSQHLRKDIENEPMPMGVLLDAPTWMTASQKRLWENSIANAPRGLLRKLDAQMLSIWVVAADMHEEATQKVIEFGMVIKSPKQGIPMQSPYYSIINRQSEIMLRAAAELGFSPTSRSRITLAGGQGQSVNKFSNNAARRRA